MSVCIQIRCEQDDVIDCGLYPFTFWVRDYPEDYVPDEETQAALVNAVIHVVMTMHPVVIEFVDQ